MLNFNKSKISLIIIFSLFFLFFPSVSLLAAAEENADDYILKADDIIFKQQEQLVFFSGNASYESIDFVVEADQITVDRAAKVVKAVGNLVIHSEKNDLYGESLNYNYQNESGKIYGAKGSVGELNFSGKTLEILSVAPIKAEIEAAEFTPCIRENPHYHFKAKEVKINADNSLDIFQITPYIGQIPVFYLPYYSASYDPSDKGSPVKGAFPFPKLGYNSERGMTAELSYPYQLNDKNSGKISYITEGSDYDRYEKRVLTNNHQLTDNLTFKNRYYYLYDYDLDDEELEEEEEEFFSSLVYNRDKYGLEAGIGRDLLASNHKNRYLFSGFYNFNNGLNTNFKQEYDFDWERVKEKYLISYNQETVNWNLKYIDGEDYNYYPYLTLSFPVWYGLKTTLGTGRVENGGHELNKERLNLAYNLKYSLNRSLSYHLNYNYRLDHYRSDFNQNYHYTSLNTGFKHTKELNPKLTLNSSLFYEEDHPWGKSPLPDDREDKEKLIKPSLNLNIKRELPQSSVTISSNGIYDLDLDDWEEINLRLTQNEDCYTLFLNYEFVDNSISIGVEI